MKFYGQFDPPVDRFIFERYFPDAGIKGVFVECGAFDGELECSCRFFEETMGWTGFNIEPVPAIYNALCKNRPDSKNLNIGLSREAGRAVFKHAIHPVLGTMFGNGSISHAPAHLSALEASGCMFEDIEISTTTWREFIADNHVSHVDLFVLDVEGHELSVIDGMFGCDVLPDVMCVEFGHAGFHAVRERLGALGYLFDIISHGNAYFVRQNVVGLFALRRCAPTSVIGMNSDSTLQERVGPLAFVHIPKCSGTAFENYVLSHHRFGKLSRAFTGIGPERDPETLREYFDRTAFSPFLFGHIPYPDYVSGVSEAIFATFVRDPVKRTISHYRSWHDPKNFHPNDPHYLAADSSLKDALLFSQKATLEEFVRSDNPIIKAGALGNVQTRYLSTCASGSMDEHLESAKKNLGQFDFFGITERFEESIDLFRRMFPDAHPYDVAQSAENRSQVDAGEITPEIIDAIRVQTPHDVELYEYARALFQERLNSSLEPRRTYLLSSLLSGRASCDTAPRAESSAEKSISCDDPAACNHELLAAKRKIDELEATRTEAAIQTASKLGFMQSENRFLADKIAQLEQGHAADLLAREQMLASVQAENDTLKALNDQISATHAQLADVYRNIVASKGWRAVEALNTMFGWLYRK